MSFSSNDNSSEPIANINVTPLVDVMLVLLVIFMVTAPMMQQGVNVNLPKARAGNLSGSNEQLVVSIDKDGKIFIGKENSVSLEELPIKMAAILKARENSGKETDKVYIKADQSLDYGKVMKTIAAIKEGGAEQVGLVAEAPTEKK